MEPYHAGHDAMIEEMEDVREPLTPGASQYSVIANMLTRVLFEVYILRPDGSELLRFNGGWAGNESDFWENKRYANILANELNSLLVLPFDHPSQLDDLPF